MGLFDKRDKRGSKKSGDDFDSPVENIDLSAPAAEPEPRPAAAAAAAADPAPAPVTTVVAEPPPAEAEGEDFDSSFGINKAIELMRTLPADNVELVVQVVKLTLESTKIRISTIIEDASRKQDDIQGRIKVLKAEIAEFEKEIAVRREEIASLEADFDETSTVKERLVLAEQLTNKTKPAAKKEPAKADKADKAAKAAGPRPGVSSSPLGAKPAGKATVVAKK
jgi:hypothetical protein